MQAPINAYYLFRCDDPKRPSWMDTKLHFGLFEMAKVETLKQKLDADKVFYDLVVERFDPNTDTILSNDYIVQKNWESSVNTEQIPADQRKLIQKALTFYLETSEKMVRYPSDTDEYERFDMRQLREMMEYPINIEITPEQRAKFCAKHGMDFPEYV